MTTPSNKLSPQSPRSWWTRLLRHARLPAFQFMVHDRWANVLFLHWRIPSHLEDTLEANTYPFVVEKYDGSAWIGLILLTEEKVGPAIGRNRWTCVTHHGINVRTYVRGMEVNDRDMGENPHHHHPPQQKQQSKATSTNKRGIHFSSLECDDEFTSFGANFFGMPYKIAQITRNYGSGNDRGSSTLTTEGKESSTLRRYVYKIKSDRLPSGSPSFVRMLLHALNWWRPRVLHSTIITTSFEPSNKSAHQTKTGNRITSFSSLTPTNSVDREPSQRFTVNCWWSRRSHLDGNHHKNDGNNTKDPHSKPSKDSESKAVSNESFHEWSTERYFVYTHKYGRNWRGRVDHEPWPLELENPTDYEASGMRLEGLEISGVDAYEPKAMRPILRHMAHHRPNRVGFSPGVGPVRFTMLQPV